MKKQLLFATLATALLAGCVKNEIGAPDAPATHISAKATGAQSTDTKAPLAGSSLNGQQAQVFTTTSPLDNFTGAKAKMFTDAYARGTMTFADNSYVQYDLATLSGSALLPTDKSEIYLYGFYPTGWTTAGAGTYESLSHTFDGKTDLMATWVIPTDLTKIAYQGGTLGTTPDKADFLFRHLLTRYNVQVKTSVANGLAIWGRIKSMKLKTADIDKVSTGENFGYTYSAGGGTVSFYKMGGTTDVPTYSDDQFEQAAFANMLALTTTYANACYAIAAPVDVDADATTAELILVIETLDKDGGRVKTVEVPLSFDRTKLSGAVIANNTSGYSITIALNFRAGEITASAIVEAWKDGGEQNEPVRPLAIGDVRYGGVVYWIDAADKKNYKVVSVVETPSILTWAAKVTYAIGSGAQSDTDAKGNAAAIKAYYDTNPGGVITESTFDAAFPPAAWCYNYKGKDGTDAVGTWYLPAKTDLQYLWCAYNGKAPISWDDIETNAGAPADAAAQSVFNKYLTDAGGANITASGGLWSGTENNNISSYAWYVDFSNGLTNVGDKGHSRSVRCVRGL